MSLELGCRERLLQTEDGKRAVAVLDAWEIRLAASERALAEAHAETNTHRESAQQANERYADERTARLAAETALKTTAARSCCMPMDHSKERPRATAWEPRGALDAPEKREAQMPTFLHSELVALWNAINQYVENRDYETDPPSSFALSAQQKLEAYLARDRREQVTAGWDVPTTANGGYTVGDALGFQRPDPVSGPLQAAAGPANSPLTGLSAHPKP